MIQVLQATESESILGRTFLSVEIKIDGKRAFVGGLDPKLSKAELLSHLESRQEEILASIPNETAAQRLDLIDLPSADGLRAEEILSHSPDGITQPELWELVRIMGKKLGYKFD